MIQVQLFEEDVSKVSLIVILSLASLRQALADEDNQTVSAFEKLRLTQF